MDGRKKITPVILTCCQYEEMDQGRLLCQFVERASGGVTEDADIHNIRNVMTNQKLSEKCILGWHYLRCLLKKQEVQSYVLSFISPGRGSL